MKIDIKDNGKPKAQWFTTTNIILVLAIANFIFLAGFITTFLNANKIADDYRIYTNNTTTSIKSLIKSIDKSDQQDDIQTKYLLAVAVNNSYANYLALVNSTNKTNTLINSTNTLLDYLTENFGAKSGYLEREDFQYRQANKTYEDVNKIANFLEGLNKTR